MFPLLDDSRMIVHDKIGEVRVATGVVFVGTLNIGFEYTGIDPLDEALRDRFHFVELGYLPPAEEEKLIVMRTGLSGRPLTSSSSWSIPCATTARNRSTFRPAGCS